MKTTGSKEPYLDFLRELVIEMLGNHGKPAEKRPMLSQPDTVLSAVRFDEKSHWIVPTPVPSFSVKSR